MARAPGLIDLIVAVLANTSGLDGLLARADPDWGTEDAKRHRELATVVAMEESPAALTEMLLHAMQAIDRQSDAAPRLAKATLVVTELASPSVVSTWWGKRASEGIVEVKHPHALEPIVAFDENRPVRWREPELRKPRTPLAYLEIDPSRVPTPGILVEDRLEGIADSYASRLHSTAFWWFETNPRAKVAHSDEPLADRILAMDARIRAKGYRTYALARNATDPTEQEFLTILSQTFETVRVFVPNFGELDKRAYAAFLANMEEIYSTHDVIVSGAT